MSGDGEIPRLIINKGIAKGVTHLSANNLPRSLFRPGRNNSKMTLDGHDQRQPAPVLYAEFPASDLSLPSTSQLVAHEVISDQIIDEQDSILITQEDLFEAGVDAENVENLTDEQLNLLISVHEQRAAKRIESGVTTEETAVAEIQTTPLIHTEGFVQQEYITNPNSITVMISDDGGLKLTEGNGNSFFFSASQLGEMGIDVNSLSDENVQNLIHMAMPTMTVKTRQGKLLLGNYPRTVSIRRTLPTSSLEAPKRIIVVGEEVHLRDPNGDLQPAVIRYIRNEGSYKVQLVDGSFQWATEDQLTFRSTSDHEVYAAPVEAKQRVVYSLPKRRVHNELSNAAEGQYFRGSHHEANFCCPICDRKVYQREPAYIVIRLPACYSCTKEKIIILDDQQPS